MSSLEKYWHESPKDDFYEEKKIKGFLDIESVYKNVYLSNCLLDRLHKIHVSVKYNTFCNILLILKKYLSMTAFFRIL